MSNRIVSTIFNAAVVVIAATVAVWLTITGQTWHIGGLLLMMGGVLGAVMFGFRVAEGVGPDRLSIYAGPVSRVRPSPRAPAAAVRKAA